MQEPITEPGTARHVRFSTCGVTKQKGTGRGTFRPPLFAVVTAMLALFADAARISAQSQITIVNQAASEGRPISPAGSLIPDATTGNPAVGSFPVNFVRSPDHAAKDGGGRFLIAVNSGYGIQFSASTNEGQQSLSVIDLNAQPVPRVIQNVYFPSPQSANVGAVFAPKPAMDGAYTLYVSGGYENKIWIFRFNPRSREPISPPSPGPDTKVTAPFISAAGFASQAGSPRYQHGAEPVYPTGLAISPDGETLFVANDLGDSLGIIESLRYDRRLIRVGLGDEKTGHFVYPYGVVALAARDARETQKVYVSCWATASVAVKDLAHPDAPVKFIPVERHPTEMILNAARTRLYVANSNADSVSAIDTARDRVVETISVRLEEKALTGSSPESLALSADGATLYVANAHSNAIAVVALSPAATGTNAEGARAGERGEKGESHDRDREALQHGIVRGFIPTGQYPSAVAVANGHLIVGNGKGTGFENSSLVVNNSGRAPNGPNDRFPAGRGGHKGMGGEYDVALIAGNYSLISEPDAPALADYTNQVLRNDGRVGSKDVQLFAGKSPIHHVIYIIRENRTYDQVFGDVAQAGNGQKADGDASLAIFGGGETAQRPGGPPQNITPNAHALAARFGLLDRFFVNSEASPDGHNWTDAAFSNDYVDKVFRWNYSDRGRTYDFQGENRLPDTEPRKGQPSIIPVPATPEQMAAFIKQFVPYLNGARDVGEPETLYLWDNAARAGISYRTFGEFMGTISQAEVDAFNANREHDYPDTSPTAIAFPSKKALENHASPTYRAFDLYTPDSMTVESYRAAKQTGGDPLISSWNADARFQGYSRMAAFLTEFRSYVDALNKGRDTLPAFTIMHLPNDHTNGMRPRMPTPQFYVAENDYALGLLVQEVSSSPYWKDTAIFVLEDDAQDGADHVDAHRSPALVISAYNRPGVLVHQYHNTVSLVRTMELLLGMPPMNQLDAAASPIDVFQSEADMRRYKAVLPEVALNNLLVQPAADRETARYIRQSEQQNFASEDLANPRILNRIIWYSVRGRDDAYPRITRLPVFDVMRTITDEESVEQLDLNRLMKTMLASRTGGKGGR
jgi:YVTN family beta-propeller protein